MEEMRFVNFAGAPEFHSIGQRLTYRILAELAINKAFKVSLHVKNAGNL